MIKTLSRLKLFVLALAAVCVFGAIALSGCSSSSDDSSSADTGSDASSSTSGTISVISREDGSGTRDAFTELFGVVDDDDIDMTTSSAVITNSTAVMMTTVAGDSNAIGYISLGSLDDSVKALEIDGVAPSVEAVQDGSYTISRPFNVVTGSEISDLAQDFLNFIMSSDGQAVITEEGYVSVDSEAAAYEASSDSLSGTVTVAGSSSVTPVMEALAEAYEALNPDVTIEVNQSDSSTGVQNTIEGVCDLGMASRELSDSEIAEGVSSIAIAQDGIAVIVNNENSFSGLTSEQVRSIFTGEVSDWSELS